MIYLPPHWWWWHCSVIATLRLFFFPSRLTPYCQFLWNLEYVFGITSLFCHTANYYNHWIIMFSGKGPYKFSWEIRPQYWGGTPLSPHLSFAASCDQTSVVDFLNWAENINNVTSQLRYLANISKQMAKTVWQDLKSHNELPKYNTCK